METAINNTSDLQVTDTTEKKKRGRPTGSTDPNVIESKKVYAQAQVVKLEARLTRLHEEIKSVELKIDKHNSIL